MVQLKNSAGLYWKAQSGFSFTAKKHQICRKIHKFVKKIIQMNIMLYTIASINLIVIFIRRYNLTLSLNNYPEFQVSFTRFKQSAYVICITFWQFPMKKTLQFSNFKHSRWLEFWRHLIRSWGFKYFIGLLHLMCVSIVKTNIISSRKIGKSRFF